LLHVGTKHFYFIFFWAEIFLIYSQNSADYFIISGSLYVYKCILLNTRNNLKGRRGENLWVEAETELKVRTIKVK